MTSPNMDMPTAATPGLGAILRKAREGRGLSQADLARQLNLGARLVDALERGDLSALPGPVYVRGYLRRWANALQLDESMLQRAYEQLAGSTEPSALRVTAPIGPMREPRPKRRLPWLRILLALSMIGAVLYAARFLPEDMPGLDFIDPPVTLSLSESDGTAPTPLTPPPTSAQPPLALSIPAHIETPPAEHPAPTLAPVVGEVVTTLEPVKESPAPVAPALDLGAIGGESWVRIKDATGTVLFEGILKSGTTRQIDGKRPFEIIIGNAESARLSLDGQPVDLGPYRRPNGKAFIARLGG
ncbi:MAG: helix-turn-helix domain-containing protein [Pseudomonadota bacterium]